jgi:hypothetical protein
MTSNILTPAFQEPWCSAVRMAHDQIPAGASVWAYLVTVIGVVLPVVLLKASQAVRDIVIYRLLTKRNDLPRSEYIKLAKVLLKSK